MKTLNAWDCQICGQHFTTTDGFSRHIHVTHNISSQEYYDMYIKKMMKVFVRYVKNKLNLEV